MEAIKFTQRSKKDKEKKRNRIINNYWKNIEEMNINHKPGLMMIKEIKSKILEFHENESDDCIPTLVIQASHLFYKNNEFADLFSQQIDFPFISAIFFDSQFKTITSLFEQICCTIDPLYVKYFFLIFFFFLKYIFFFFFNFFFFFFFEY